MDCELDQSMMARALQLARLGRGHVSPNPMVGAVIVGANGRIIGEGFHRRYGGPHAEVNAVAAVGDRTLLRGATIYVTLEPCSHYGKTPPCASLLIESGFTRVVVGCTDPNPLVAGRGINLLRQAGIDVTVGVLEAECRQLNRRFMYAHENGMPWVMLKWAQTSDGRLAAASGEPRLLISTPFTTVLMHRERRRRRYRGGCRHRARRRPVAHRAPGSGTRPAACGARHIAGIAAARLSPAHRWPPHARAQ